MERARRLQRGAGGGPGSPGDTASRGGTRPPASSGMLRRGWGSSEWLSELLVWGSGSLSKPWGLCQHGTKVCRHV